MSDTNALEPEDYLEPACVLCGTPHGVTPELKPVPQQRIVEKMDEYMARRDYTGAERHLLYWLEEARLGQDERGELMLHNELVGHYRKVGNRDEAFEHAEAALSLLEKLDMEGTLSAGTTYVNTATAMDAFDEDERAIGLFECARAAYEASSQTRPELLGGLYNNMALTCVKLGRFAEAHELYGLALDQMAKVEGGELEQAITYLNMADAAVTECGMEAAEAEVYELLDKAAELFDTTAAPRNGYYAFVCEKCAPTFAHYGYFIVAEDLEARAAELYAEANEGDAR